MESTSLIAIIIFIGIQGLLAFYYVKLGNLGFWSLANKLPEEFMEFADKNDHIWKVSNSSIKDIGSEYTGPFKMAIFGSTVSIYAFNDGLEKSQAEFITIYGNDIPKKSFPFPSLLFLIYPILAMADHPNPSPEVIETLGYGFTNLGYLLFAAIIPGSFRIFGMEHRTQILIRGLITFGIGVVLVNF